MHRPVLVTAPTVLPISVAEVKAALRVTSADFDTMIENAIRSAVAHYEGWTGILGRVLSEQEWQQDYDCFARWLPLPVSPVISITSVNWRNTAGEVATIEVAEYGLETDPGGRSHVRFRDAYAFPTGLYERGAVSVVYKAGYALDAGASTVPYDIRTAIILRVQLSVFGAGDTQRQENIERAEHDLLAKYGPVGI